jgi:putative ubiquitin-RnfH superfamily antitoxin RatB of RatAB toxin-antitoxin module
MEMRMHVSVVYALPQVQRVFSLQCNPGATIASVIALSGILQHYPEIDLGTVQVGIFSQIKALSDTVAEGDRIEIYRPLLIDPKQARRLRQQRSC